ncbi:MAG: FG-GAP-like repeat-containing protein [Pleurocapsa sp.]
MSLPQTNNGALTWGDYDNDGDLDLFIIGTGENGLIAQIYNNRGELEFDLDENQEELKFVLDENQSELEGLSNGDAAWADYDNDGDLDLAVIGKDSQDITIAGIYQNNFGILNNFIALNLEGSEYISEDNPNSIAWGDYDNDGYLDLLVTATATDTATDTNSYHQIYQNNQDDSFSDIKAEQIGTTSPNGKSTWADFNNDGQLDVILSGEQHATFENQNGQFQRTYFRDVNDLDLDNALAAADYDRDGDLDFLANPTGNNNRLGTIDESSAPAIYENLLQDRVNEIPVAPTELTAVANKNSVTLEWNLGADEETPVDALSYNLRVGTTPGGNDIVASMSNSEGLRSLPALGNVNYNTSWQLSDLPNGTYYWSVQTIDSTFAGSAFSDEGEFTISNPQLEINDLEIIEGDTGEVEAEFTVTLNVETLTEPITVDYATVDGTAIAGEEYQATSGTLTFNPASEDNPVELSKIIRVKVFGDREQEDPESFSIQLSNPSDNAEILAPQADATIISEASDGDALFPDYSFTEFEVNITDSKISVVRGGEIAIAGTIIDQNNFDPENPPTPSYRIYLSQNQQIDLDLESSDDISLVNADSNNELQIELENGEYIFNQSNILIPSTVDDGYYYIIAQANPEQIQPEEELDNNLAIVPITITTPTDNEGNLISEADVRENQEAIFENNRDSLGYQLPDLEVSNINVSGEVKAGQNIEVSWTVNNKINPGEENSQPVIAGTWDYEIYLSQDDQFDPADILIKKTGENENDVTTQTIESGTSQVITDNIVLPNGISGEQYLFIASYPVEQFDFNPLNNFQTIPLTILDQ